MRNIKTFNITVQMLQAKGAGTEGIKAFLRQYSKRNCPDGVDYQELLDACAANDAEDHARWLLNAFGKANVKLVVAKIESEKAVFFSGSIDSNGCIKVAKSIMAGGSIAARRDINVGRNLYSGGSIHGSFIRADGNIEAGEDISTWYMDVHAEGSIQAGGSILGFDGVSASKSILAGHHILTEDAGEDIKAGGRIFSELKICAGFCIEVGNDIETGWCSAGEDIIAGEGISTYGNLVAGGNIKAGNTIDGGCIRAGGNIFSEGDIVSCGDICAGRSICAGDGSGIWTEGARRTVKAKEEPSNIFCGRYVKYET